jgi:hypothetical protein
LNFADATKGMKRTVRRLVGGVLMLGTPIKAETEASNEGRFFSTK